jgi:hypothetical protein
VSGGQHDLLGVQGSAAAHRQPHHPREFALRRRGAADDLWLCGCEEAEARETRASTVAAQIPAIGVVLSRPNRLSAFN